MTVAAQRLPEADPPFAMFPRIGGPLFSVVLILSAVFSMTLMELRSEKIFAFPADVMDASSEDIAAFWRGGSMALSGDAAAAYTPATFREGLSEPAQGMLWLYPPHAFLIFAPVALAPYGTAKLIWLLASIAALVGVARLARVRSPLGYLIVVSPAAFAHLLVFQMAPFIAVALLGALLTARDKPILAGALLAALTIKPQFGLLIPIYLAACGHWRAIGWAAVFSMVFAGISLVAFGADAWVAFFASLSDVHAGHATAPHRDMLSVQLSALKLGASESVAAITQLTMIGAGAAIVWISARRFRRDDAIGVALLAFAAASPSLWVYDWPIVAAGMYMLARNGAWPVGVQLLAGALWIAPLYSLGFGTPESALAAPALLIIFLMSMLILKRPRGRAAMGPLLRV